MRRKRRSYGATVTPRRPRGGVVRSAGAAEGVAQAAEDAPSGRAGHLAGRMLLAAQGGELAQQRLLLGVEPGRGLDDNGHDEGAAPGAVQPGHAVAAQDETLPRLGPGLDRERNRRLDVARDLGLERREL